MKATRASLMMGLLVACALVCPRTLFASCADSVVEPGEQCDEGAANGTAASCCDSGCNFNQIGSSCTTVGGGICNSVGQCVAPGACGNGIAGEVSIIEGQATLEECDNGSLNGASDACCDEDCLFSDAGKTCRVATGDCDVRETCTGSDGFCPADAVRPVGSQCGLSSNACEFGAVCDGGPSCLSLPAPEGLVCEDGDACTVEDVCRDGTCTAGLRLCDLDARLTKRSIDVRCAFGTRPVGTGSVIRLASRGTCSATIACTRVAEDLLACPGGETRTRRLRNGRPATVKLRLNSRGRRLLSSGTPITVEARLEVPNGLLDGQPFTFTKTFVLGVSTP